MSSATPPSNGASADPPADVHDESTRPVRDPTTASPVDATPQTAPHAASLQPDGDETPHLLHGRTPLPDPPQHRGGLDKVVFGVTAVLAIAFVIWGLVGTASLATASSTALDAVMVGTGWVFVLLATVFVIFVLWLAASRYGNITLGADAEAPEFRTTSWIAMMFSAGMGIGLMFYGAAEPLSHFVNPPPGSGVKGGSPEALQTAMATSMFHWALHPWAIYAVVGVSIAYSTFRRGRSQLFSSVFAPLFGSKNTNGFVGKIIDMLAIFATLFGSAASLGLGALQIAGGLEFNGWVSDVGGPVLVLIIVVLTLCFILSATSGIAKGVQWLSNINMWLALALAVFVFVAGPTLLVLNLLPTSLASYIGDMAQMSGRTDASGDEAMHTWLAGWTVFYWAWWISWTPFVGMFIARISRGRTIRQFVSGVLLVPSVVSLVWFAIFGGAAVDVQRRFGDLAVKQADGSFKINSEGVLFQILEHYPIATITTVLVMVLVAIFFVSGADAASIVMGTLSERGAIEPTRKTVVFWGVATGAVAAVMLWAGIQSGDSKSALTALQNIVIVASVPFVIVMGLMCVALVKDLSSDPQVRRADLATQMIEDAVVAGVTEHGEDFHLVTAGAGVPHQPEPSSRIGRLLRSDRRNSPRGTSGR